MLKFYIEKEDEREGDGYARIMEFETHHDLEDFLRYNRAYITKMQTLDEDERYNFHNLVTGEKVTG
jgi:hypothetical protein